MKVWSEIVGGKDENIWKKMGEKVGALCVYMFVGQN